MGEGGGYQSSLKLSTFEGDSFFWRFGFRSPLSASLFFFLWSGLIAPIPSQLCKWENGGHQSNLELMGRGGTFLFDECFSSILVIASVVWSGLIAPYRLNIVNGLTGGHQSSLKLSTFEGWQFFLTICFLSIIGILVFCLIWSDRPILSEHCKWGNGGRQCNLGVRSSNQKLRSSEWGFFFS